MPSWQKHKYDEKSEKTRPFGWQTRLIFAKILEGKFRGKLETYLFKCSESDLLIISNMPNFRLRRIPRSDYLASTLLRCKIHSLRTQRRSNRSKTCRRWLESVQKDSLSFDLATTMTYVDWRRIDATTHDDCRRIDVAKNDDCRTATFATKIDRSLSFLAR